MLTNFSDRTFDERFPDSDYRFVCSSILINSYLLSSDENISHSFLLFLHFDYQEGPPPPPNSHGDFFLTQQSNAVQGSFPKSAFVGVINEEFNSVKVHGMKNVKLI